MRVGEGCIWGGPATAALAYCLVLGAVYCLHLLWKGKARGRHILLLATSCFLIPKMSTLLARGEVSQGERLTYSGLVSWARTTCQLSELILEVFGAY